MTILKICLPLPYPASPERPTVTLDKSFLRLKTGQSATLNAQADPDGTTLEWQATPIPISNTDKILLNPNDISCTVTGDTPGYFRIYSFPKEYTFLGGDFCFLAVTMQDTTSTFEGAWKISSTDSTEERGFYCFSKDGEFYRLKKGEDGKFHYNSKVPGLWIQTAASDNEYTFRLLQMTTSSGDGVYSSSENLLSIRLKANDDETFQIQRTSLPPEKIEKIAKDLLCDDAQSQ